MSRSFPWLSPEEHYTFPPPERATAEGILCVGGNLSPGMLLSAYRQGVFPWFAPGEPILWWCPDPRFVVFVDELHVSRSMRRLLRRDPFRIAADVDFPSVIRSCARVRRRNQRGTWITSEMERAYCELHRLGYAHSFESRVGDRLVGGLYGVSIGRAFFAESMFSLVPNASKAALVSLASFLGDRGFPLIDAQVRTENVAALGGRDLDRARFLALLSEVIHEPTLRGSWTRLLRERSVAEGAVPDELPQDRVVGDQLVRDVREVGQEGQ